MTYNSVLFGQDELSTECCKLVPGGKMPKDLPPCRGRGKHAFKVPLRVFQQASVHGEHGPSCSRSEIGLGLTRDCEEGLPVGTLNRSRGASNEPWRFHGATSSAHQS